MAIQLQWSLDKTIGSTLSIARGIFLAANNDNVQPLAIVSCEKFGNTIAMCQDTCKKIENLTAKTPEPVAIKFLRVYAGFDAADSASQLSKSQAGVQFLGLAAALVTSMEGYRAGASLHKMLESSASDKTLLPTTRQLKDLLLSLEPRLVRSGFLNTVIGWQSFLTQSSAIPQGISRQSCDYPGLKGINHIVNAFRELSRVGESDIVRVSIKVTSCAPWVIAFTKWCLGLPPSIYLEDGTSILEQPSTKVDVIIDTKTDTGLHVFIHRDVGPPFDLVDTPLDDVSSKYFTGMANVEDYGRWSLSELGLDAGSAKEALLQALPLAIKQILQILRFGDEHDPRTTDSSARFRPDFKVLLLSPFPEEHVIAQAASRYLSSSDAIMLSSSMPVFLPVGCLPAVNLHLDVLRGECSCANCNATSFQRFRKCTVEKFYIGLTFVCADILALSLFGAEIPLLHVKWRWNGNTEFITAINSIISTRESDPYDSCIKPFDLLNYALALTGSGIDERNQRKHGWIMSSFKGQVMYPVLYETLCYEKRGYLTLNCLPGRIRYNGEVYTQVYGRPYRFDLNDLKDLSGPAVKGPRNLIPDMRIVWLLQQADDVLEASLSLKSLDDEYSRFIREPTGILLNMGSSFLLEACAHDPDAMLEAPDKFCVFTSPLFPVPDETERDGIPVIGVVAINGSDDMRSLSLASFDGPVVLRKKACLSCCLDVCRRAGCSVVVL